MCGCARSAAGVLSERVKPSIYLKIVTLEEIPCYSEDLDTGPGVQAVTDLKRMITESDGVVIATPEYNPAYRAC